jgi:hypothetical protein
VKGSFTSSGTLAHASGTITFGDTTGSGTGSITSSGEFFFDVVVEPNYTYTAEDTLTIANAGSLDVNGTLKVENSLSFVGSASFEATAGTVEYSGSVAQTVVVPPGNTYYNLTLSNGSVSGVTAATVDVTNNLTISSGTFNGTTATLTVGGNWSNSGTFDKGTSNVIFNSGASQIQGSSITEFYDLQIAAGTLSVSTATTPANSLKVNRTWDQDAASGFTAGTSTVSFTGGSAVVTGDETTEFFNLTIASGATLSVTSTGDVLKLKGTFTNNDTFTAGITDVQFTGTDGHLAGSSATTFAFLTCTGKLTLDAGDDLTVVGDAATCAWIPSGGTMDMQGSCTLRLGDTTPTAGILHVEGSFLSSGSTPTVTDAGGGTPNRYAFTVEDGGTVTISALIVDRPDGNGLNIVADAGTSIDVDGANFTNGPGTGAYLRVMYAAIATGTYTFTGTSFDGSGDNNVKVVNDAVNVEQNAISMVGSGGSGAGDANDDDPQDSDGTDTSQGSVRWPAVKWTDADGGDSNWSTAGNWDPGLPDVNDRVIIDPANFIGPNSPTLDQSATVASITIAAGASITGDDGTRNLTVNSNLSLAGTAEIDFQSKGTLTVSGVTSNSGTIRNTDAALSPLPSLSLASIDNAGTLTLTNFKTDGITVGGNLDNSGTLTMGDETLQIQGNWDNSGTFTAGTGTVKFTGSANQSLSGGGTGAGKLFNNLEIANTGASGSNTVSISSTSADVDGAFTISNGNVGGDASLYVSGNWTNTSGDGGYTAGSWTVFFDGVSQVLGATTTTFQNVTITGTLTAHATLMKVAGNWTNNGTFNDGTTIEFSDTTTIGGSTPNTFTNVTASGTASCAANLNIEGTLSITGTFTQSANTLQMGVGASAGAISVGSGGTFALSGATTTVTLAGTANYSFDVLSGGAIDITDGIIRNTDADGLCMAAGSSITNLKDVEFRDVAGGAGSRFLWISASSMEEDAPGVYFDTLAAGEFNVVLNDTDGGGDVALNLESLDDATHGPGRGAAYESEVNGAQVNWLHGIMDELAGTLQGFPSPAFDLGTFAHYSTYVVSQDYSGGDDAIYVLDGDGILDAGYPLPAFTVPAANGNIVGTPFWTTEGAAHTVYFGTSLGYIYKLVDTGTSLTTVGGFAVDGRAEASPKIYEVTTSFTDDGTNVYFGGEDESAVNRIWAYVQATGARAFVTGNAATRLQAAPATDAGATTYIYFGGQDGRVSRLNVSTQTIDLTNTTPNDAVTAAIGMHAGGLRIHAGDYNGAMHGLQPDMTTLTGWATPRYITPHADGDVEIRSAPFISYILSRVYWGDSDGHVTIANSDGTTVAGYPVQPEVGRAIVASPAVDDGDIYIGNDNGKVFLIDEATAAVLHTYRFGTNVVISEIAYQWDKDLYLVAGDNGKVYYIPAGAP